MEKTVPITAKKDRPIIVWRIWRPVSRSFSSWNRPISWRWRPKAFDSRMPDTERVSSVIDVRSANVVRQARLDLPGPGGREEPKGHELEVAVQRVPEVLHDPQSDKICQISLPDPDDPRDDGDGHHQRHAPVQRVEVGARPAVALALRVPEQRMVEDPLDQEGVHHAEAGGHHDGQADERHLPPVRAEGADHPADRLPPDWAAVLVRDGRGEHAVATHASQGNRLQRFPLPML